MIRSMTGYGRAHLEDANCAVTVEIRSVNNRFLKVSVRGPEVWERLSRAIEGLVKERVSRGSVFVNVRKIGALTGAQEFLINRQAIEDYRSQLAEVEGGKDVPLSELLALPGTVGTADETDAELDEVWEKLSGLVNEALEEMIGMRAREGEHLREVLREVAEKLGVRVDEIRVRAPDMVVRYRDRLEARVNDLLQGTGVAVSQTDLARELAIFAERSDIREEVDRMDSHLKQFVALLDGDGPVGRRLEFLVQEMLRETNTMGSKGADPEVAKTVLDAKVDVDRLKEQVMNVE
ncbi:MAG TPA: YicC/YloC family endoribonuclease [Planctomycetota bacterium]|nr:YicC/YloC family endoribonuclease [Planctomycetota bacterium]